MYSELYQYLLHHKSLPVPGIGTFLLERTPAVVDFPNKQIAAPVYGITLSPVSHLPGRSFFTWLSIMLGISDREAIFRFNDFAFDLKKKIAEGHQVDWDGVGTIAKNENGETILSSTVEKALQHPVPAMKVIRERPEHSVRVGEDHRSAIEMQEILAQNEERKSYWWAFALVIAAMAVIFIGWYFSEHGVETTSVANTSKFTPVEAPATYELLP